MSKTVLQVLIEAKELLSDPNCWIKGSFAQDHNGSKVQPWCDEACSWCAEGAVMKTTEDAELYDAAITLLKDGTPDYNVPQFNDHPLTEHEDIVELFNMAIDKAQEQKEGPAHV